MRVLSWTTAHGFPIRPETRWASSTTELGGPVDTGVGRADPVEESSAAEPLVATGSRQQCGPCRGDPECWLDLGLIETRTLPCGVVPSRYETRR
ncbi:hypothetical protein AMK15_34220 [Streptomyces sp. MJM1172]|nr:hypothetical protein AMK15_34220 [Streptomyces sp. MJM1172]